MLRHARCEDLLDSGPSGGPEREEAERACGQPEVVADKGDTGIAMRQRRVHRRVPGVVSYGCTPAEWRTRTSCRDYHDVDEWGTRGRVAFWSELVERTANRSIRHSHQLRVKIMLVWWRSHGGAQDRFARRLSRPRRTPVGRAPSIHA